MMASVRLRKAIASNTPPSSRCPRLARLTKRPRNRVAHQHSRAPTGTTRPDSSPFTTILNTKGLAASATSRTTIAASHHRLAAWSSPRAGQPSTASDTWSITNHQAPTHSTSWVTSSVRTAAVPSRPRA